MVEWACPLCEGADGAHDADCNVEKILAHLEELGEARPQGEMSTARAYHEHIVRITMIRFGYMPGHVVRACASVRVRKEDGAISWVADLPDDVDAHLRMFTE